MIRKHPFKPGKPQLVLLDHGLYKELNNEFRINYCRLDDQYTFKSMKQHAHCILDFGELLSAVMKTVSRNIVHY